jgi:(p)ppGpp synthase/HD superfamily hydrolase
VPFSYLGKEKNTVLSTTHLSENTMVDLFQEAWAFAVVKHEGQSYGSAVEGERVPYITHIGSVIFELQDATREDMNTNTKLNFRLLLNCAALHDVVEDCGVELNELAEKFGADVAAGVSALTKNTGLPKEEQMQDSLNRLLQQPKEVQMVKLADRITNLYAAPHYWSTEKQFAYLQEAELILKILGDAHPVLYKRLLSQMIAYRKAIAN